MSTDDVKTFLDKQEASERCEAAKTYECGETEHSGMCHYSLHGEPVFTNGEKFVATWENNQVVYKDVDTKDKCENLGYKWKIGVRPVASQESCWNAEGSTDAFSRESCVKNNNRWMKGSNVCYNKDDERTSDNNETDCLQDNNTWGFNWDHWDKDKNEFYEFLSAGLQWACPAPKKPVQLASVTECDKCPHGCDEYYQCVKATEEICQKKGKRFHGSECKEKCTKHQKINETSGDCEAKTESDCTNSEVFTNGKCLPKETECDEGYALEKHRCTKIAEHECNTKPSFTWENGSCRAMRQNECTESDTFWDGTQCIQTTTCTQNQYEQSAPTRTADRVCEP